MPVRKSNPSALRTGALFRSMIVNACGAGAPPASRSSPASEALALQKTSLTRRVVLAPGEALSFCGLDCHLHVSVDSVRPAGRVGVVVRFSSDAVRAPEWPDALRFRLRDKTGTEYAPSNRVPRMPVLAGQAWTHELQFPGAATPAGAQLIVTWGGWLDYFVPGEGNPLVQRQHRLSLTRPASP